MVLELKIVNQSDGTKIHQAIRKERSLIYLDEGIVNANWQQRPSGEYGGIIGNAFYDIDELTIEARAKGLPDPKIENTEVPFQMIEGSRIEEFVQDWIASISLHTKPYSLTYDPFDSKEDGQIIIDSISRPLEPVSPKIAEYMLQGTVKTLEMYQGWLDRLTPNKESEDIEKRREYFKTEFQLEKQRALIENYKSIIEGGS